MVDTARDGDTEPRETEERQPGCLESSVKTLGSREQRSETRELKQIGDLDKSVQEPVKITKENLNVCHISQIEKPNGSLENGETRTNRPSAAPKRNSWKRKSQALKEAKPCDTPPKRRRLPRLQNRTTVSESSFNAESVPKKIISSSCKETTAIHSKALKVYYPH